MERFAVTIEENGFGRRIAKFETREEAETFARFVDGTVQPIILEIETR